MDQMALRAYRLAVAPTVRRMSIVAWVYRYLPDHNAGSEWMMHSMPRPLAARGHQVSVWLSRPGRTEKTYEFGGGRSSRSRTAWTSPPGLVMFTSFDVTGVLARAAAGCSCRKGPGYEVHVMVRTLGGRRHRI